MPAVVSGRTVGHRTRSSIVAVLLVALVAGCGSHRRHTEGSVTPTQSVASPLASLPGLPHPSSEAPGTSDDDGPADPAPPIDQAADLAARFAVAWARPDLSADAWWAAIQPLCDPGFAASLRTTDPANVPARSVTGPPVATTPSSPISVTYSITTDGGTLLVTVAAPAGRWLVVGNDFQRATR